MLRIPSLKFSGRSIPLTTVSLGIVFFVVALFSLRLLSDPDLGFHLNAGQWIVENQAVPTNDISTYTVPDHEYIDIHWLFQLLIYGGYLLWGYKGLSMMVSILVLMLFFLLFARLRMSNVSNEVIIPLLFIAALVMEPRFFLRPELFTNLFLVLILILLDLYQQKKKNLLWLIPVITLIWCNVQGLFMLGYVLVGSYFIDSWIRNRKPDIHLLMWGAATVLICVVNPYGISGFLFPFELLTRFREGNIFHEHIKEFQSLFSLRSWTIKDYIFTIYFIGTIAAMSFTRRNRKIREWMLVFIFGILSLSAIRNIPLFIIVTLPISGIAWEEVFQLLSKRMTSRHVEKIRKLPVYISTVGSLLLIPTLLTNAYYPVNLSYNKTGIGLDTERQPEAAARFLLDHHLNGRVLNSLSFGGWLSWRIPQPIFIDARLEVIDESLYKEVVESWANGLGDLIDTYKPGLIVYDYNRYYTWTPQLVALKTWTPVFLDGQAAIWIRLPVSDTLSFVPAFPIPISDSFIPVHSSLERTRILGETCPSSVTNWIKGLYQPVDSKAYIYKNMASFLLQTGQLHLAEYSFLEALDYSHGCLSDIHLALAGIYNETSLATARHHFNEGNAKYRQGDLSGALREYTSAIELNPFYAKAYNNRGLIKATNLQDFQSALIDFDSAIFIDPTYADAYLGRGSTRLALRDKKGALADWQAAASLDNEQAKELIKKFSEE